MLKLFPNFIRNMFKTTPKTIPETTEREKEMIGKFIKDYRSLFPNEFNIRDSGYLKSMKKQLENYIECCKVNSQDIDFTQTRIAITFHMDRTYDIDPNSLEYVKLLDERIHMVDVRTGTIHNLIEVLDIMIKIYEHQKCLQDN